MYTYTRHNAGRRRAALRTTRIAGIGLGLVVAAAAASLLAATSTPDAEMQAVLTTLASLDGTPVEKLSAENARKQPTPADAVHKLLEQQGRSAAPEPVANVENRSTNGPAGPIALRVYWPSGAGPFPIIFYVHGGGWVLADLDTYDASARALTNAAEAVVVSTHYRQAPEHPYPAAHDDVFAAYEWTVANASRLTGDATRIAVAGESVGGNMAAVVSLRARDRHVQMPVHQLLIYPVAGADMNTESYRENANAKPLNKAMMDWFVKQYFGSADPTGLPELNLAARHDLSNLPATTIITADIDPLRSDGQMLAKALMAAGVAVRTKNYQGVTHEFFGMGAVVSAARDAVAFAASELKQTFALTRRTAAR